MKKACSDVKMTGKNLRRFFLVLPLTLVGSLNFYRPFPGSDKFSLFLLSLLRPGYSVHFGVIILSKMCILNHGYDDIFFISNVDMSWTCY